MNKQRMSDKDLAYLRTSLKQNCLTPSTQINCKYHLPCGRCEKTSEMCSQEPVYFSLQDAIGKEKKNE